MTVSSLSKTAIAFLVAVLVGFTSAASADPITVRSGGYYADYGDPALPWEFEGDNFRFEMAIQGSQSSYWGPFETCFPCPAGAPVDLSLRIVGLRGNGDSTLGWWNGGVTRPAQIGGVTYPVLYYSGSLNFSAPPVPASTGTTDNRWLEQPFVLFGHITAFTTSDLTGPPVFDWDLTGRGKAGILLGRLHDNGPANNLGLLAIRYQFEDGAAVVPEPSTLLLLGSALAAGIVRERRRRRKPGSIVELARSDGDR